jgi:predicted nuclease of restriction endonuclease-like (RecB) superfamily
MKITKTNYIKWVKDIKQLIAASKSKAALSVNEQLLQMYWQLGHMIIAQQQIHKWGDAVIEQLSIDLQNAFPDMKGFSRANLFNCKKWCLFYSNQLVQQPVGQLPTSSKNTKNIKVQQAVGQLPTSSKSTKNIKVQQAVGQLQVSFTIQKKYKSIFQIPWGHNIAIIEKTSNITEALFYVEQTIQSNWSRSLLVNQIEMQLHKRKGSAVTNFKTTLSTKQANAAVAVFKDPYIFDFLSVQKLKDERDLENQLTNHITKFLLELGKGFAFVGKQYHIEVSKKDYYIDLLFYHLHLRCYVVIELKTGSLLPEHVGKLNFYLSAIDDLVANKKNDNPTIGIVLCKEKDNVTAEYALRGFSKPLGVAQYDFVKSIPVKYQADLPSIKELEKELKKYHVNTSK